jgi:hypothetical protein
MTKIDDFNWKAQVNGFTELKKYNREPIFAKDKIRVEIDAFVKKYNKSLTTNWNFNVGLCNMLGGGLETFGVCINADVPDNLQNIITMILYDDGSIKGTLDKDEMKNTNETKTLFWKLYEMLHGSSIPSE